MIGLEDPLIMKVNPTIISLIYKFIPTKEAKRQNKDQKNPLRLVADLALCSKMSKKNRCLAQVHCTKRSMRI